MLFCIRYFFAIEKSKIGNQLNEIDEERNRSRQKDEWGKKSIQGDP